MVPTLVATMTAMTLKQEQEAFDRQLNDLFREHANEFVLFHSGTPVAFYPDEASAYAEALRRFGPDGTFLIAQVAKSEPAPVSVAWDFGVMFGAEQ
jgi:hypothetical protein